MQERLTEEPHEPDADHLPLHPNAGPDSVPSHQSHPQTHHDFDSGGGDGGGGGGFGKSLKSDTIILMVSLIVMIFLGKNHFF